MKITSTLPPHQKPATTTVYVLLHEAPNDMAEILGVYSTFEKAKRQALSNIKALVALKGGDWTVRAPEGDDGTFWVDHIEPDGAVIRAIYSVTAAPIDQTLA